MATTESLGYLKGLLDGLGIDEDKKEAKIYRAIIDVLENINEDIDDMTEGMEMLAEQIDAVDEDLADVEDFLMDDDDYDCCDCDDCCDCNDECGEFEVECPLCGAEITVDEETVLNGAVPCPNCGEMLEFEIEEEDEEEE